MASTSPPPCAQIDNTFGPSALNCRGGFDFTLLFEESILTIAPLALFFLILPFRILHVHKSKQKVVKNHLLTSKIAAFTIFGILQLALVVLWAIPSAVKTKASVATASLRLVGVLTFTFLSYYENERNIRPSSLLSIYLFFSLIFDIAQTRTLWLMGYNRSIAIVALIAIVVKLGLFCLEVAEKRRILESRYESYPPESKSGIFNRVFFIWLNTVFRKGFGSILRLEELDPVDKKLGSKFLQDKFQTAWAKVQNKKPHALLGVVFGSLKWPLLAGVPPRLCLIAFNYTQPFLISRAIAYSVEANSGRATSNGVGLIGAYAIVYIGISVCTARYQYMTYRSITMMRGGLISLLFAKTANLSINAIDSTASLTLMSADIERICTGCRFMHDIWANTIEVAIAIWLLQRQLGLAVTIAAGVAITSLIASIGVMSLVVERQKSWLLAVERRIAATAAMLGGMKQVKMCGLSNTSANSLQKLRVEELDISKAFRKLLIWNMALMYITPVVAPVLTFALFATVPRISGSSVLDQGRVFTSLSLFTLFTTPLSSLLVALISFMSALGCFDRIQSFITADDHVDTRLRSNDGVPQIGLKPAADDDSSQSNVSTEVNTEFKLDEKSNLVLTDHDAMAIQDGSFQWGGSDKAVLEDINLRIPQGKITMIVGPVGCGKSTLLKGLLGEVPATKGSVAISSTAFAFCDQNAWLMNGTIQQSILGDTEFDPRWYSTVVNACCLDRDLGYLPDGDNTQIGSKGFALSGGQSQRISLARAVYSRKDTIVLDDVMRGLDTDTESLVFNRLFGAQGVLRQQRATVVLTTSTVLRLPFADLIIALGSDGKIAEQGDFETLNSTNGYVSSFSLSTAVQSKHEDAASSKEGDYSLQKANNMPAQPALDDANRRTGDMTIYKYYVDLVGRMPSVFFVVAITVFIFCTSFPQIWLKWWASAIDAGKSYNLNLYIGIYALLGGLALFFLVLSAWQMFITMIPKSGVTAHWILLQTVMHAPLSFSSGTDTGVTLNRFSQDLQLIDMELPLATLNTVISFILCMAQLVLIAVAATYVAISFPFLVAVFYFIQKFYLRTSRQLRFMDLEAKSPLYSQFLECLNGLATIRAYGWRRKLESRNHELLDTSQKPFYLLYLVQRWLTLVLELVIAGIAVMLMTLMVGLRGQISPGYVGVAMLNVIAFSQSIKFLINFWTIMETQIGAVSRVKSFSQDTPCEIKPTENTMPPPLWPAKGAIEFKDVSAAFVSTNPVVKHISLSIAAGQKIAICGRTGSGKSSLILSLFRMIELTTGSITVDDLDISTMPRDEVRSRIIGVSQDTYLLRGNVRLNADPTGSTSDETIIEVLKKVQLWEVLHEKGGLELELDEKVLSHGQRQLFCLARAMLRQSRILILDEATSSVDSRTEEVIQQVVAEEFKDHTVIAVVHKLETAVGDYDKIAVLSDGELVEFDTPANLLASPFSTFKKLYDGARGE